MDETITGFRWGIGGAQEFFGVNPDLTTFGKAMANGFSLAAVGGKSKVMELGSIKNIGQERLFLLSSTHGSEISSLSAFIATVDYLKKNKVIDHIWRYGEKLIIEFNKISKQCGTFDHIYLKGPAPNPILCVNFKNGKPWLHLKTVFLSEMIKNKIIISWISICYQHKERELKKTLIAAKKSLKICKLAINQGCEKFYSGKIIKPVFRKYN